MSAPPSGVVTFLFTDVEGSTRRWEADADGMRAALAAHDEVLRAAIEATGEAELRDGDYFGTVLNRAARVMAAGHGEQILLADSTAKLLTGVDLLDLGPRRLRDLPLPVGVFQVHAPGLRTDFPSLKTLDATPGNLRPAVTSFIGRESEIGEIEQAVRTHRLVTLTGVGGMGKTRLATEVAAGLAEEFPGGVWLFELATVTDPEAVPDAVAAVLGIIQQIGQSVTESITAALADRVRLLVFDNCEHVLDAAADLVEAILAQSDTLRILATSREGLGVADEQLWPVPSLDVDEAAVQLFVERARAVAPHFKMSDADGAAVVEICRRLDGIPLAIELAASRMASMTASEVRDRLDQRFRLLVGSRRGLARHHTLRHAVQWSYDLLGHVEKSVLTRCSVFAGGFDLESARAVAGFDDDYAVLDVLDALVRKSLLVADRSTGRTRFSMLETIRQFAEDQLAASGEAEDVRATHAGHFAQRIADTMKLWDSPRQREAYSWFTAELVNLRTAFRWAADNERLTDAVTIATNSVILGNLVEQYEPITWVEELIEPARAVDHPGLGARYEMASTCWLVGRGEAALGYAEAGQAFLADHPDYELPHGADGVLGAAYNYIGQPDREVAWCRTQLGRGRNTHTLTRATLVFTLGLAGCAEEAMEAADGLVEAADATRNPYALSYALFSVGFALRGIEPDRALHALRRGMVIAEDSGNRSNVSIMSIALSNLEIAHGDPLAALDFAAMAIRNYLDSGGAIQVPSLCWPPFSTGLDDANRRPPSSASRSAR